MEELLQTLIAGAPNLAVSLAAIWWLSRKLDKVLDVLLTILIDRLDDESEASRPDQDERSNF